MEDTKEDSKSLVEMLAELDSLEPTTDVVGTDDEDSAVVAGKKLSKEERILKVFDLKMRGVPADAIARTLGISVSTVQRDIKQHAEDYRKDLEQQPAANLIAESLTFYDEIERVCLYEATQAGKGEVKGIDSSGRVDRASADNKEKLPFIQTAMRARDSKIKLMMDTGILPREPEKIYHALKDDRAAKVDKSGPALSEEELKTEVLTLLSRARTLG